MKLYYHSISPNGFRAILALRLLKLEAEEIIVDFGRDLSTPEFKRLNPNQRIPVVVDGDFALWESNAIIQYLASLKPEVGMLPKDEKKRADVLRWQCWNMNHFGPAVGTFNWENLLRKILASGEPDQQKLAQAEKDLGYFGAILEHQLTGRRYVTGDTLTVADVSLASTLMYRVPARVPLERFPQIRRFLESIESLEAWKISLPKL